MLYKEIAFNIEAYHDRQDYFIPWSVRSKINNKFCNKIKRLYGCDWTHGQGDRSDTYFCFYFLDKRMFTQSLHNKIKAHIKTMGIIINEFFDSPTKYNHYILKHHDAIGWPTWYRNKVFVDCNMQQYKKVFGGYWYIGIYRNREGVTLPFKYSYLQKVEVRNYKQ